MDIATHQEKLNETKNRLLQGQEKLKFKK